MVRKMFLTSYARRDEHGDLDPREVWPESDELPEGVTSLRDHKKGLIDQVVPLCMQKRVSHARKQHANGWHFASGPNRYDFQVSLSRCICSSGISWTWTAKKWRNTTRQEKEKKFQSWKGQDPSVNLRVWRWLYWFWNSKFCWFYLFVVHRDNANTSIKLGNGTMSKSLKQQNPAASVWIIHPTKLQREEVVILCFHIFSRFRRLAKKSLIAYFCSAKISCHDSSWSFETNKTNIYQNLVKSSRKNWSFVSNCMCKNGKH